MRRASPSVIIFFFCIAGDGVKARRHSVVEAS
jgi:hypothetical protein